MNNTLNIRYLNVQHYTKEKEPTLTRHLIHDYPYIILITSTGRTRDQPLKISGYITYLVNKGNEIHAGSAVAIKKGIKFKILDNFQTDTIGAEIETSMGPVVILTGYSPPRHNFLPAQDLQYMIDNRFPALFAGDLNARHTLFGYTCSLNTKGRSLSNLIYRNRLNHIGPNFNTFFTRNSSTKPDIVLTNNKFFLNYHIAPGGLGPSDHLTMNIKISVKPIKVQCTPIQDINKVDWDLYKNLLSQTPIINLDGKTLPDIPTEVNTLYTDINEAKDTATPTKTVQLRNNIKVTAKFKRLTKVLDRYAHRLLTHGKTEHLDRVIRDTQLLLQQEGNLCKMDWWETQLLKIEQAAKCNKTFWRHVKAVSGGKNRTTCNLIVQENGRNKIAKTDEEKAEVFTKIWSQVYRISPEDNQQFCKDTEQMVENTLNQNIDKITPKWRIDLQSIRDPNTNNLPITETDVINAIKRTANKTPGPSKLRKPYFSNLPQNIITNITHIFNCCYATGFYPQHFKLAEMIFIPKGGPASTDPTKYRPISLLNFLGKILASILNKRLVQHLETHNILKQSQHGFRRKRSSTTLIGNLYERLSRELAGGRNRTLITIVLRDVKKAFDRVWHRGLVYKLMQTGIETPLLRILTNFLQNRKAQVKVNKSKGQLFDLTAGVPQGDVLSPTLYLVMANDYPQPTFNRNSRNFVKQYADDLTQVIISKFTAQVDNARKEIHIRNVQEEITKQNDYEKLWKIQTNTEKFQIIHIARRKMPQVIIQGRLIPHTSQGSLLGMDFSYANFFTKQVEKNRKKADNALKNLYRFRYLKKQLKLRLYKTLILPLLTYPVIPLNALSKNQLNNLQVIQNKATLWVCNEYYPNRQRNNLIHHELKLETLEERLQRLAEGVYNRIIDEDTDFWR